MELAYALNEQGMAAHHAERDAEARAKLDASRRIFHAAGHTNGEAMVLVNLAEIVLLQGEVGLARDYLARSLLLHEQGTDPIGLASALLGSAEFRQRIGDYYLAHQQTKRALAIDRSLGLDNDVATGYRFGRVSAL